MPCIHGYKIPFFVCIWDITICYDNWYKTIYFYRHGSITIYDGPSEFSPVLGKYCGSSVPPRFISSTSSIFIMFITSDLSRKDRFILKYRSQGKFASIIDTIGCDHQDSKLQGVKKKIGYPFPICLFYYIFLEFSWDLQLWTDRTKHEYIVWSAIKGSFWI